MYLIKIREDTEVFYDEDVDSFKVKKEVYSGPFSSYEELQKEVRSYLNTNCDVTILEID